MSLSRRKLLLALALGGCWLKQPWSMAAEVAVQSPASLAARVLQARPAPGHREPPVVTCIAMQPGGNLVAIGGDDHILRIWDASDGKLKHALAGHEDWIRAVAFLPEGDKLISAGNDRRLLLWTIAEGGIVHKQLARHEQAIVGLCVSNDGKRLAAAGFENRLGLYDTATGELLEKLACPCRDMRTVAFSPDGKLLAGAGRNGRIRIWNTEDMSVLRNIEKAHSQRVRALAFSADGLQLASAGEDRATRIWAVASGEKQMELAAPGAKILSMCYLADDRLATAGSDNAVRIWNLKTGREANVLKGHTGSVAALAYRDGMLVSGGFDTTVRLWQLDGQSVASGGRTEPARRE